VKQNITIVNSKVHDLLHQESLNNTKGGKSETVKRRTNTTMTKRRGQNEK